MNYEFELSARPVLKEGVGAREEKFGRMLFVAGGKAFSVNNDGIQILDLMDGSRSVARRMPESRSRQSMLHPHVHSERPQLELVPHIA